MMLEPPGATITEAAFRLPGGGRKTVRNGLSKGPSPVASGTLPGSQSGMLKLAEDFSPALSAARRVLEMVRATATRHQRLVRNMETTMQNSVRPEVAGVKWREAGGRRCHILGSRS